MAKLRLRAEEIAREIATFERRLAGAPVALAREIDPRIGASPRQIRARLEGTTLHRYESDRRNSGLPPLLIVYALVNRPYMTDLMPGRSFVGALLERGIDVYLIDWGEPDRRAPGLALDDYVGRYLDAHVDAVRRESGSAAINVLGICQGGVLSLCYAALHPEKIRNLVTTVTPIDFQTPHDRLSVLMRHLDPDLIGEASHGAVEGGALNALFLLLKPYRLTQLKYLELLDRIEDPEAVRLFLKMEQWLFDSPALALPALREFVRIFYHGNGFVVDDVAIGGRAVSLRTLRAPILNIYAQDDDLVPPEASRALSKLVATRDYTELELPGGHIGIYVGKNSAARIAEAVERWLAER